MIRNPKEFERVVSEHDRRHPLTLEQKLAIQEGLYEEARTLGHFSSISPDVEAEVRTAKILNSNVSEAHR